MKFIMLIHVKMPTIVGILTFKYMINTTSEHLKARKVFSFKHFRFYEVLKFHAHLSCARKKFGARACSSTQKTMKVQTRLGRAKC